MACELLIIKHLPYSTNILKILIYKIKIPNYKNNAKIKLVEIIVVTEPPTISEILLNKAYNYWEIYGGIGEESLTYSFCLN